MTTVKLSKLKPNPNNPRFVKDDAFQRMLGTMEKFPQFLSKRPIVIDSWENPVILAGNVRYKALKQLKYKEIPIDWVKEATDLSDEEKRAFMVLDNTNAGQWDFDTLANEWDIPELESFGVFIPNLNDGTMDGEPGDHIPDNVILVKLMFTQEEHAYLNEHIYDHGLSIEQGILSLLKNAQ